MPTRTLPRDETPYEISLRPARRAAIQAAWAAHPGRPGAVAEALGLSKSTLYREIGRAWRGKAPPEIAADLPGYRPPLATVA